MSKEFSKSGIPKRLLDAMAKVGLARDTVMREARAAFPPGTMVGWEHGKQQRGGVVISVDGWGDRVYLKLQSQTGKEVAVLLGTILCSRGYRIPKEEPCHAA